MQKKNGDVWEIYTHGGRNKTGIDAVKFAKLGSETIGGKGGGGRKDFAQSGGMVINEDDQKRELRKFIIGKLQ